MSDEALPLAGGEAPEEGELASVSDELWHARRAEECRRDLGALERER